MSHMFIATLSSGLRSDFSTFEPYLKLCCCRLEGWLCHGACEQEWQSFGSMTLLEVGFGFWISVEEDISSTADTVLAGETDGF